MYSNNHFLISPFNYRHSLGGPCVDIRLLRPLQKTWIELNWIELNWRHSVTYYVWLAVVTLPFWHCWVCEQHLKRSTTLRCFVDSTCHTASAVMVLVCSNGISIIDSILNLQCHVWGATRIGSRSHLVSYVHGGLITTNRKPLVYNQIITPTTRILISVFKTSRHKSQPFDCSWMPIKRREAICCSSPRHQAPTSNSGLSSFSRHNHYHASPLRSWSWHIRRFRCLDAVSYFQNRIELFRRPTPSSQHPLLVMHFAILVTRSVYYLHEHNDVHACISYHRVTYINLQYVVH